MKILKTCTIALAFCILHLVDSFNVFPISSNIRETENDKDFGTLHTMESLVYWANKDEALYKVAQHRLKDLQEELRLIDKYMEDYEGSSMKAVAPENLLVSAETPEERGKVIGSSAVLSHVMITRYVTIIDKLRKLLSSEEYIKHRDDISNELDIEKQYKDEKDKNLSFFLNFYKPKPKPAPKYPNWQDVYTSHWAFIHIHEVYGFPPEEMSNAANGKSKLPPLQCAKIAMFALNYGYYYMAIEWLELTVKLLGTMEEQQDSISLDIALGLLKDAIVTHNHRFHNYHDYQTVMNTFINTTYFGQPAHERVRGRQFYEEYLGGKTGNDSEPHPNFLQLCKESNSDFQPLSVKQNLKCYLERKLHPYFTLNPVKTEQISEYPYVVQLYDVLGNETINELINAREADVREFELIGNGTLDQLLSKMKHRTSSSLALPENGKLTEKINRKSSMLTGLRVDQKKDEILQITEYIYGRYYTQHVDAFPPGSLQKLDPSLRKPNIGSRLATILYYVQQPDRGGSTPFCELGKSIKSKRGSAVFWINLYRNGTDRQDVTHGACPVLHGNKIVVNRWIAYDNNFQTFKCSLNHFE